MFRHVFFTGYLVVSFVGAFLTAETERYRDIHVALGYVLFGLLGFRLVWGLCGTRYAKFRSFLFKPVDVFDCLLSVFKGKPTHHVGRNPAGSVAV
jgi:cytochrome b